MKKTSPYYRPDIDGLRAVAVLSVIFYHYEIGNIKGGFVGVDIFFVISGYLITSIILRDLEREKFSFARFWEKRFRRILPALFVVSLTTSIGAYFIILHPTDFVNFGKSVVAQGLFIANILFLRRDGYFDAPSDSEPLLHTWSLAVEEQFYLTFPLIMWIGYRFFKQKIGMLLIVLVTLSFSLCFYYSIIAPHGIFSLPGVPQVWRYALNETAAFYFPLTRMWEIGTGALLAASAYTLSSRKVSETIALIGLLIILWSIWMISPEQHFPGIVAIAPVMGTSLIILAHTKNSTVVSQILSFKPFLFIGLLSYSLYLWHWPLLVMSKIYFGYETLNLRFGFGLLLLTGILSFFTYHFIEQPFRNAALHLPASKILWTGAGTLLLLGSIGWIIIYFGNTARYIPPAAQKVLEANDFYVPKKDVCTSHAEIGSCYFGDVSQDEVDFILWGDSHAEAILKTLDTAASSHGLQGRAFIHSGCRPILGYETNSVNEECLKSRLAAISFANSHELPVLMVARWDQQSENSLISLNQSQEKYFATILRETIEELSVTDLFLLQQVPHHVKYSERRVFTELARAADNNLHINRYATTKSEHLEEQQVIRETLFQFGKYDHVTVLDPVPHLCPEDLCLLEVNGTIYYKDDHHLNSKGANVLLPIFDIFLLKSTY